MKITDAIAAAPDTGAVYGLLGAYFEAVQGHDIALTLPARLTCLPIDGMLDVARRHSEARELYMRCAAGQQRLDPLLGEFSEVCGTALQRLKCLSRPLERAA